ncbi:unnamed protein product [Fraxinus pennsylvanica]|uniref:PHD finger transcription factor n=1 Tax=Fraxinus pennsylvanica TaxID=56036 RepID=A0AAD1ZVG0_9LAMI|nr:unnamed protein product [Fraxinus pennsylvanica]
MADYGESCGQRKRLKINSRKFLVNQRVEVRSLEDGFLGSWHVATVISSENLVRRVKYDHLLSDDGSDNLIEHVNVTPMIDGVDTGVTAMPKNHRGRIRPLPPSHDMGTWCLQYGQCVDLFHEDAWWEGVIFDREDSQERRRIFFPDMGDEIVAGIHMLRLTQDWDEVTDEWKPRGSWFFLELIEEARPHWSLPVSIKQIWYDVRVKSGFEKLKYWTSSVQTIWRELVLQVLVDNFKITIKQFLKELNFSGDLVEEGPLLLEFPEPALEVILNQLLGEYLLGNSLTIVPSEATYKFDSKGMLPIDQNETSHHQFEERNDRDDLESISEELTREEEIFCLPPALPILSPSPLEASRTDSNNHNEAACIMSSAMSHMEFKSSKQRKKREWVSVVPDLVPGPEFCPNAIVTCCEMYRWNKNPSSTVILNVRKHLLHLGWKIDFFNDGKLRMRYTSPDGIIYYSIRLLCLELGSERISFISHRNKKSIVSSADDLFSSSPVGNLQSCSKLSKLPCPSDVVKPKYWPQAVKDYCLLGLEDEDFNNSSKMSRKIWNMALKAMKHLSAMGWSFYDHGVGDQRKMQYCSPGGTLFNSLKSACKQCVEIDGLNPRDDAHNLGGMGNVYPINGNTEDHLAVNGSHLTSDAKESHGNLVLSNNIFENMPTESSDASMSKGLVELGKVEVHRTRILKKGRKRKHNQPHHNDVSPLLKRGSTSIRSIKLRGDMDEDSSTPVLRSSKRAREAVGSSSHRTPRTVLSWLIDNNVVLPRTKVQYRSKKDGRPMAEGRVTRDGIKCSCCQKIFTLSSFEAHAGSTNHRPSANIFLEDGRSLVECQLQLRRYNSNKSAKLESCKKKAKQSCSTNDYICSICHYGGELVLCDNCPSSFHTHCLGLKEVPDGDWFCPTCCCGICCRSGFDKNKEHYSNSSLLSCAQCEHQYHVGCLRNKGFEVLEDFPQQNWFCKETCEQIFWSLRNILGRAVPVGNENLTWTLMKYIKPDSHDHEAPHNEFLMESYSKLNIALSVMHECFEPVKEPHTRRDLMEDVIFSRWSELNRLNFQGFYTVLLERNDELISVATVRIYGKKVAEVPLVATRFQYRRLGMCRILMNELEKKLIEMGVERLILPAVPNVLNTWKTSFGFLEMKQSERMNFLDYTFLDFQDTVMCQKVLTQVPSSVSRISTETKDKSRAPMRKIDADLDGIGSDSAISQAERVQEGEFKDQGSACVSRGLDNENGNDSSQEAILVNEPTILDCPSFETGITVECHAGVTDHKQVEDNKRNGIIKCYKRRRMSAC